MNDDLIHIWMTDLHQGRMTHWTVSGYSRSVSVTITTRFDSERLNVLRTNGINVTG